MNRDTKNPNAFPYSGVGDDANYSKGMALRDYFAARAMQAELTVYQGTNWPRVARQAYQMADEMMKAREA